jgi:hypothetical protein
MRSKLYKYVSYDFDRNGLRVWKARVLSRETHHDTEREAAVAADKLLLSFGKEPVNILKKKE